ncbi:MAG: hypothetical protein WC205_06850 [Opitutaceae bacterium]|jgi:uncharacterized lipoprotein YajG
MKNCVWILTSIIALLTSGCVTGRRVVPLAVPTQASYPVTKDSIYVTAVTDGRTFLDGPSDPSTPSVDGSVTSLTADQKDMMIGRQRNTYGRAMGDVALPANDSVTKIAKGLLEQSLKRRGYALSTDPKTPNSASVSIDEFWAWFTPGFASIAFEARVYCTVTIKRSDVETKIVIKGYGINRGQVASNANWELAYTRAFDDFLVKIDPELQKAGL